MQKKRRSVVLILVVALLVTLGLFFRPSGPEVPKDWKEYASWHSGFVFKAPKSWYVDRTSPDLITLRSYQLPPASVSDMAVPYEGGEATVSMTVQSGKRKFGSIDSWLENFKKTKTSRATELSRKNYAIGGRIGTKVVWKSPRDGQTTDIYYLLLPGGTDVFTLSVYGNLSENNKKNVELILDTIRFK